VSTLRRPTASLAWPISLSAVGHIALVATVIWMKTEPKVSMPPVYRVDLVAAPAGPVAAGVVSDKPAPAEPAAKTPPKAETKEKGPTVPTKSKRLPKPQVRATPNVTEKSTPQPAVKNAPKAGGGAEGGAGTDVANVHIEGIDFPYPGYLQNIVRQIRLNFQPKGNIGALRAQVFFMIHRDGSVSLFRFITRSGVYAFDLEARGAIEAAAKSFGPLPAGFPNDALPIVFDFAPDKLR